MFFPKKLHQDTAPRSEAPGHLPAAAEDGQRQLPDAWRVVLEDGSTSDRACSGERSPGAGGKLFEELAAALVSRAEAQGRPPRPRNVAMPSSPPQPFDALDDGLSPAGSLAAYPGVESPERERQPLLPSGFDARLARVVDLWPRLPRGIQAAILAMIEVEAADAR